jgi:aspartate 1-decarboxylase
MDYTQTMQLTFLKSKIHRAHITDADIQYEGSITIDQTLMEAANILEYEKVLIGNITSGNRFETYAIKGPRDSGIICLNGAAAHLGKVRDIITIFTFAQLEKAEIAEHKPIVVQVDATNRMTARRTFVESHAFVQAT